MNSRVTNGDCPKCKSTNLKLNPCIDDEDGTVIPDLHEAHCNVCGWDFLLVVVDD